jgi:hypothetical protein
MMKMMRMRMTFLRAAKKNQAVRLQKEKNRLNQLVIKTHKMRMIVRTIRSKSCSKLKQLKNKK